MAKNQAILLDLNIPTFQEQLLALDAAEVVEVFAAFKKLKKLDWPTLHKHKGFHWEDAGHMEASPNGSSIKSIRITQKVRALAVTVHPGGWADDRGVRFVFHEESQYPRTTCGRDRVVGRVIHGRSTPYSSASGRALADARGGGAPALEGQR